MNAQKNTVWSGLATWIGNRLVPQWLQDLYEKKERLSNFLMVILVGAGALALWLSTSSDQPISQKPVETACPHVGMTPLTGKLKADTVANSKSTLTIYIGRRGYAQARESNPLTIQSGEPPIAAGTRLCTANSDFVRSDGATLPAFQVTSYAVASNNGRNVTIHLSVAPRYKLVGGYGRFSGSVSLNDSRAGGGVVPVTIYVDYPNVNLILLLGLLLSTAGLIWGLLVRVADNGVRTDGVGEPFWGNMALRVAVIATSIPIINTQAISNPSWTGSVSDFIKLGGVVGAAAIAATPSLRAIVSRMKPKNQDQPHQNPIHNPPGQDQQPGQLGQNQNPGQPGQDLNAGQLGQNQAPGQPGQNQNPVAHGP